jgi:hypothetical protein
MRSISNFVIMKSELKGLLFLTPYGQAVGRLSLLHTDAYPVHCVSNSGTDMLAQPATSAASCMVILAHLRRNRRLFSPFPLPAYQSV